MTMKYLAPAKGKVAQTAINQAFGSFQIETRVAAQIAESPTVASALKDSAVFKAPAYALRRGFRLGRFVGSRSLSLFWQLRLYLASYYIDGGCARHFT
jgi:hypothetical protein